MNLKIHNRERVMSYGYEDMFWQLVKGRTIMLSGRVDQDAQEDITAAFAILNCESADPIRFLLDSEGGSANHALIICDAITHSEAPVIGLIRGRAHSAAFIISQALKRRIAYPHATFLIHGPGLDGLRSDQGDLAKSIEFRRSLHTKMLDMIARRSGQSIKQLRAWSKEEYFFDAEKALELNFIDEIAQPPK